MTGKVMFAALPLGAIGDDRLSALDLRVLACIAYHDRMSTARGKGQGAWASNETLAQRVGCHYTRLSTAITRLGKFGYLEREPHPLNKRLRVYRVIYDSLPNGKASPEPADQTLCGSANQDDQTLCRDPEKTSLDQEDGPVEYISLSDVRYSAEAEKDIPLKGRVAKAPRASTVSFRDGEPLNETLAKFERQWKLDKLYFSDSMESWRDWLLNAAEFALGRDDIAAARAQRMGEEVDLFIDYRAWERGEAAM